MADPAAVLRAEDCPDKANHTPSPTGYLAWWGWVEQMKKTHNCRRCPACRLWVIWIPKQVRRERH